MPIFLDNEPVQLDALAANPTVGQFIDDIRGRLRGTGRIILSIGRDGEEVANHDLSTFLTQPLTRFRDLEFRTGPAAPLVRESLEHARKALVETYAEAKASADDLAAGDLSAAMGKLLDCVRTWAGVHEAIVMGSSLLGVEFNRLETNGRTVSCAMAELTRRLNDLKESLESRDHVRLGDVLRFEIDDMLAEWESLLNRLMRIQ